MTNTTSQEHHKKPTLWGSIRAYAITGILVLLPIVLTVYIIFLLVVTLDNFLVQFVPLRYRPETWLGLHIPGTGLVAGFILTVLVGALARNFIGKRLVQWWEDVMNGIPGIRIVYGAIKQIVDALAQSHSEAFREAVLIEYPRQGLWSIGFVTGRTKGVVQQATKEDTINVFLPTTPNPTSGYLLMVPKADAIPLAMTVDQAIKMIISGGIVTPTATEAKQALQEDQKSGETKDLPKQVSTPASGKKSAEKAKK